MNPTLFEDNIVCLKKYNGEKLKQGNIIQYNTSEGDNIHRIVAIEPDKIVVKGDNNKVEEVIDYISVKGVLVLTLYE